MRILITGIESVVLRRLIAAGHDLRTLLRGPLHNPDVNQRVFCPFVIS